MSANRLFCFGLGYCAEALLARLAQQDWRFAGTVRDEARGAALAARGVAVWPFDGELPLGDFEAALAGSTHLLISAPPGETGDPVLALHRDDIARLQGLAWIGYLSTTGVYGDRAGAWVDETSALTPSGTRGRRRVEAEAGWLALHERFGLPVHVFRLAGIYGPGRSAIDALRQSRAQRIDKPGQVFSRIHVADIAQVLEASIRRPKPGAIYNVCDDDPAPPADVIEFAAGLLGVPPPPSVPFERAEMSAMARSFYADNKRVRNERIKRELGVKLLYPDYRTGLKAILAGEAAG
jgi:nucleoside-diphosphate-sugar epimerase